MNYCLRSPSKRQKAASKPLKSDSKNPKRSIARARKAINHAALKKEVSELRKIAAHANESPLEIDHEQMLLLKAGSKLSSTCILQFSSFLQHIAGKRKIVLPNLRDFLIEQNKALKALLDTRSIDAPVCKECCA